MSNTDDSQRFSAKTREELDAIRRTSSRTGVGFWMARDLMPKLGYDTWENFHSVVQKAMQACIESGVEVSHHFRETTKIVQLGSGSSRSIIDYFLSQHGAHLIAMNGDPGKPEIAFAQMYFSVQTLKQEMQEQMTDEDRRVALRDRIKTNNKKLSATAIDAGVANSRMAVFHGAGYQGLYGGLNKAEILARKDLSPDDDLLDRSGSTELAANDFRITQAKEALDKRGRVGETNAIQIHRAVGEEVRNAIKKIGGTMPESLRAEPSIKKIESARKKRSKVANKTKPQVSES
jgi:DNA-damage-inducible protein D